MYTIKSIIPFDLLVDTDMGVIKYTQLVLASSDNTSIFYPELMKMIGPEHTDFLKYALVHRKFSNPLSAIIKEEKMLTCDPDKLLENTIEKEYYDILKLSTTTAIMNMVCKSLFISEVVQFDILCKNYLEKVDLLNRFKKHFKTDKVPANIIIDKPENLDLDNYGTIYLKDVKDIEKYKHPIEGKNIIIARYSFNQEFNEENDMYIDLPLMDVINKYTSTNEVRFIDIYADIDKGEG